MIILRDGEWTQTLAGLIPSLALQQHRLGLQRQKREQVFGRLFDKKVKVKSNRKVKVKSAREDKEADHWEYGRGAKK